MVRHYFPDGTVIAYDGKISGRMVSWGVGVQDLRNGVGHYVGGRWQDAKSFLGQEGNLDIATAEALAMHFALEWARKRDKPSAASIRIADPEMRHRSVSFVTDRIGMLMTMMSYKSFYWPSGCHTYVHVFVGEASGLRWDPSEAVGPGYLGRVWLQGV